MPIIARHGGHQRLRPETCRLCTRPAGNGIRLNRHFVCASCCADVIAASRAHANWWHNTFAEVWDSLNYDEARRRGGTM